MANFIVGVLQDTPEYGQIIRPIRQSEMTTAKASAWAKKNLDAEKFADAHKVVVLNMTASFEFKARPILTEDETPTLGDGVSSPDDPTPAGDVTAHDQARAPEPPAEKAPASAPPVSESAGAPPLPPPPPKPKAKAEPKKPAPEPEAPPEEPALTGAPTPPPLPPEAEDTTPPPSTPPTPPSTPPTQEKKEPVVAAEGGGDDAVDLDDIF